MDSFGINELRKLTDPKTKPCASIFLPTTPGSASSPEDALRLKNLTQGVETELSHGWMRAADARQMLAPIRRLPLDLAFWEQRNQGLGIFVSPDGIVCFRLPLRFEELVVVNERFHVKPLLPLLSAGDRFFLLALSQKSVRLFEGSRHQVTQVEVPGLPANMKQTLNLAGAEPASQVHSAMRGSLGKQAAVFHGQGGEADTHKDELAQYFRAIDAALQPILRNERVPLLLAGVDYLLPIYREVSSYSYIADLAVPGNCDRLSAQQVHARAWPLVESDCERSIQGVSTRYSQLAGTSKTSEDIKQIVAAAHEGRIEALIVDSTSHHWGVFDPSSGEIAVHEKREAGDDDLLDLAVVQTLLHRGAVHCSEGKQTTSAGAVAALFRY